jgi:hypothetical protein
MYEIIWKYLDEVYHQEVYESLEEQPTVEGLEEPVQVILNRIACFAIGKK